LSGLGGFLYTLVGLARSLAEPELWREAGELTALFTPERIAADRQHDVVSGSAGALLALLALERHAPSSLGVGQRCLDLADRCAERLLAARTSWRGGPRAWPGEAHPPLSGFAHGAAGIGHALLQLHHRTGRERLRTAALEGFAFERSLYDPRAGNWIDPRSGRLLEQSAWCHGAPGIALGRAASLMATDDPEVRCDLEEALRLTLALPDSPRDHLCCGNAGRIGVLLAAHRALGRPELMQAARALARRRLDRAEEQGGFAFGEPGPLSLFWGMAGVGFTLLRLDREDDLPCPLLLE
jgi:lantibiotic modifying enzyme